ncbi:NAD(P)-binding protein [Nemania sp. NC0429]|nr:NAD(P)-binding protein [Nemania sp. NC0429]
MALPKKKVLITGCSDGGIGAALAVAFHNAGYHVYATTRNPAKMVELKAKGIETLALDVLSETSIAAAVSSVSKASEGHGLDILVNNAGAHFLMPIADINIAEAKKTYDLNVFSHIAVTQAFLPLLLKAVEVRGSSTIVNQTSVGASSMIPFQSVYNSSKAAFAMLSDSMRLELQPFGIKVVNLRTGVVQSNLNKNLQETQRPSLPAGSIYEPAREVVEKALRQEEFEGQGTPAHQWAEQVVRDVTKKTPPPVIWRGESASLARISTVLPFGMFDGFVKKLSGLDAVEKIVRKE